MPNLGPSTTHTRASTTQATPAHCQAVTTSSSTHRPAAWAAVPLVGMAAGLWVLDEVVTAWQWAGVACVVLALVCVVLGPRFGMK